MTTHPTRQIAASKSANPRLSQNGRFSVKSDLAAGMHVTFTGTSYRSKWTIRDGPITNCPDGTYVGGNGPVRICPDDSYVSGPRYVITPQRQLGRRAMIVGSWINAHTNSPFPLPPAPAFAEPAGSRHNPLPYRGFVESDASGKPDAQSRSPPTSSQQRLRTVW